MDKMFQFLVSIERLSFKLLTVYIFIILTLSVNQQSSNQIDCQLVSDLTTSSKLFSDLSTGGSIFRHILSYVESGRNFLSSTSLADNIGNEQQLNTTTSTSSLPTTTTTQSTATVTGSIGDGTPSSTPALVIPPPSELTNSKLEYTGDTAQIMNAYKTSLVDTLKLKGPLFNLNRRYPSKPRDPLKEELQLRLEYIKMKILHKLGLNKAPSIRPRMDHEAYTQILELRQFHSDPNKNINQAPRTTESYYGLTDETDESDKLFLLPIKSAFSSATFNMTLDIDIKRYPFRKVTLFTKMSDPESDDKTISLMMLTRRGEAVHPFQSSSSSFVVPATLNTSFEDHHLGHIKPINDGSSNPLRYTDNTLNDEYEWREYDLTHLIVNSQWNQLKEQQPMIVIETLTSSAKLHSSLMTIEFDYISTSRRRRRVDCNSTKNTSSCCRESFYVNFTQIGWDNWIVQPPGYYANYCKGKCDISHARYHHTTVVQKYSSIINLCCSPREMSNISLIYVNESGYLFQKNLANMVVESCDCA